MDDAGTSGKTNLSRRRLPYGSAVGCLLALVLAGCENYDANPPYRAFNGRVKAVDVETGEVFVRPDRSVGTWQANRNIPCVVTRDSEVYVNDRFATLDDIRVGDAIELVGFRDKDRFFVSLGHITRGLPQPPIPDLPPPETQPILPEREE